MFRVRCRLVLREEAFMCRSGKRGAAVRRRILRLERLEDRLAPALINWTWAPRFVLAKPQLWTDARNWTHDGGPLPAGSYPGRTANAKGEVDNVRFSKPTITCEIPAGQSIYLNSLTIDAGAGKFNLLVLGNLVVRDGGPNGAAGGNQGAFRFTDPLGTITLGGTKKSGDLRLENLSDKANSQWSGGSIIGYQDPKTGSMNQFWVTSSYLTITGTPGNLSCGLVIDTDQSIVNPRASRVILSNMTNNLVLAGKTNAISIDKGAALRFSTNTNTVDRQGGIVGGPGHDNSVPITIFAGGQLFFDNNFGKAAPGSGEVLVARCGISLARCIKVTSSTAMWHRSSPFGPNIASPSGSSVLLRNSEFTSGNWIRVRRSPTRRL
jgi:hypothetical protein